MSIKNTDILSIIQAWSEGAVKLPKLLRKGVASIKADSSSKVKNGSASASAGSNSTAGSNKSTSSGSTATGSIAQASPSLKKVSSSGGYGGSAGSNSGGRSSTSSLQSGGGKSGFGFAGPKIIVKANYIRGIKRTNAHLKYIEHRQHDERSELFGKNADNQDRLWFINKIGKYDNVFRIVISPDDKDIDLKDMVREVMTSFEKKKDRELIWIAAIHTDPKHTSHPHVHMVLSGTTEEGNRIRVERGDIEFLRKEASEYVSREKNLFNAMENFLTGKKKEKEKDLDIGL